MKIQMLHCAAVSFEDAKPSKKPKGIVPRATTNIMYGLTSDNLLDANLAAFVSHFESIELTYTLKSPIQIKRDYLMEKLGIDSDALNTLFTEARKQGLLTRLTIEKDYDNWLEKSSHKGYLVVMVCVERGDYDRDDLVPRFCSQVEERCKLLASDEHKLGKIVLMPNVHLTDEDRVETEAERSKAVIDRVRRGLEEKGLTITEGSFGFGKRVKLVIMGHPKAYTFRAI